MRMKTGDSNRIPLEEIEFIRLSNLWDACRRTTTLTDFACAGRIFQRYELKGTSSVSLEFAYRGDPLSDRCAHLFNNMLNSVHEVSEMELMQVTELLGPVLGAVGPAGFQNKIEFAAVGCLKGRSVLVVYWHHKKWNKQVVSTFVDAEGDGKTMHEIHFSAPVDLYESTLQVFNETMRSIQWKVCAPPMVGSVA